MFVFIISMSLLLISLKFLYVFVKDVCFLSKAKNKVANQITKNRDFSRNIMDLRVSK